MDQLQGVLGPAQVDHLAAHAGEHIGAQRPVARFLGGVQGEHEVLLGGGLEPDVVRHPAGQFGEFGGDLEQPPAGGLGLGFLEEVGHLVQLADDRLAAQSAAALGVPLPEHDGGGLQQVQLGPGEPPARAGGGGDGLGLGLGPGQRGGRGGHEPALHGLDEGRARGEGERAPEEAAPRQHQVAARELADEGHGLRARPGQVDAGRGGCRAGGAQAQVLDGDDDAEALGEQLGEDSGDRLARVLTVEPAAHAGGVGGDVVGTQLARSAVDLPGELALGPAAADEPRGEKLVRTLLRTRRARPATAVAAHWNAPIPEDHLSLSAPSPIRMPVVGAARPAVAALRTESRVASGIPASACAPRSRAHKVTLRSPVSPWRNRNRHHSPPLRMNSRSPYRDSLDTGQPRVDAAMHAGARIARRTTLGTSKRRLGDRVRGSRKQSVTFCVRYVTADTSDPLEGAWASRSVSVGASATSGPVRAAAAARRTARSWRSTPDCGAGTWCRAYGPPRAPAPADTPAAGHRAPIRSAMPRWSGRERPWTRSPRSGPSSPGPR